MMHLVGADQSRCAIAPAAPRCGCPICPQELAPRWVPPPAHRLADCCCCWVSLLLLRRPPGGKLRSACAAGGARNGPADGPRVWRTGESLARSSYHLSVPSSPALLLRGRTGYECNYHSVLLPSVHRPSGFSGLSGSSGSPCSCGATNGRSHERVWRRHRCALSPGFRV